MAMFMNDNYVNKERSGFDDFEDDDTEEEE